MYFPDPVLLNRGIEPRHTDQMKELPTAIPARLRAGRGYGCG